MKNALITGGTRGIGLAIAKRLYQDGCHCTVTGTSDSSSVDIPKYLKFLRSDFANRSDVDSLSRLISEINIDVLVNNVGINIKGDTETYSSFDFDKMVDVNLRSTFTLTKSALPYMKSESWGRIINITSLWGVTGNPRNAAYCATKFAIDGFTASLAAEIARYGILVNSIAPGFILTEAAQAAYSDSDLKEIESEIPLGRLGKPEEIAAFASWLASDENSYMTGQNILVDGGLTRTAHP